jgi:hypothetical protein
VSPANQVFGFPAASEFLSLAPAGLDPAGDLRPKPNQQHDDDDRDDDDPATAEEVAEEQVSTERERQTPSLAAPRRGG